MQKPANTSVAITRALAERWSPRALDANLPVTHEQLLALLEAARWAPSCFGEQPWRYIIWDRFSNAPSWQRALECLTPKNQTWAKNAPLLLLSLADPEFAKNQKPNRWAQHDTGAASENLCVQAAALGLAAHQMGGFDEDKIKREFNIPQTLTALAVIAIGHPGDPAQLDAEQQEQELGPRRRKPISENFFFSSWGEGFPSH